MAAWATRFGDLVDLPLGPAKVPGGLACPPGRAKGFIGYFAEFDSDPGWPAPPSYWPGEAGADGCVGHPVRGPR
jgi:hypothetical protein